MKYRGYTIERAERRLPCGTRVTGFGIYAGDRFMSIAADTVIAKRAIDAHTKSGIWPTLEQKERTNDNEKQSDIA